MVALSSDNATKVAQTEPREWFPITIAITNHIRYQFYSFIYPTFFLDAFIGPDDVRDGYLTAVSMAEELNGGSNVIVLCGPLDQGATQHRGVGIAEALKEYPGIKEIGSVPANWSRAEAMQVGRGRQKKKSWL